ncbi:GNAT family N-acetyltransferase [Priestia megaterium]|nr:GNAT family N-acetyltransferase [Priestia megaterium]
MKIFYTDEIPLPDKLFTLYDEVKWNDFLQLSKGQVHEAIVQSWYVVSAYDREQLIGTGRIISDGIINAYLCGVVVHPDYQCRGIGREIIHKLVHKSRESNLHIQLFCTEDMVCFYEKLGFSRFAAGMKYEDCK